jgi:hypothetical protein
MSSVGSMKFSRGLDVEEGDEGCAGFFGGVVGLEMKGVQG